MSHDYENILTHVMEYLRKNHYAIKADITYCKQHQFSLIDEDRIDARYDIEITATELRFIYRNDALCRDMIELADGLDRIKGAFNDGLEFMIRSALDQLPNGVPFKAMEFNPILNKVGDDYSTIVTVIFQYDEFLLDEIKQNNKPIINCGLTTLTMMADYLNVVTRELLGKKVETK